MFLHLLTDIHRGRNAKHEVVVKAAVLFHHTVLILSDDRIGHVAHPVVVRGDVVHSLPCAVVTAIVVQQLMKVVVQRDELLPGGLIVAGVGHFGLRLDAGGKRLELLHGQTARQLLHDAGFQHQPHIEALAQVVHADHGNAAAALGLHIHEPLVLEHHHSLMHWGAAHFQLFAQFRLAQGLARREL